MGESILSFCRVGSEDQTKQTVRFGGKHLNHGATLPYKNTKYLKGCVSVFTVGMCVQVSHL